jgi:hypothetical protein
VTYTVEGTDFEIVEHAVKSPIWPGDPVSIDGVALVVTETDLYLGVRSNGQRQDVTGSGNFRIGLVDSAENIQAVQREAMLAEAEDHQGFSRYQSRRSEGRRRRGISSSEGAVPRGAVAAPARPVTAPSG